MRQNVGLKHRSFHDLGLGLTERYVLHKLPPGKLHFCNWYQQEHRETKPEMVADLLLDAKEAWKDTGLGL